MCFKSEQEMSLVFESFINNLFENKNISILKEQKGLFGIPDYLLVENSINSINYIISIELKLKNWKGALKQAFRYRSFSNESFVILDESSINLGLKNLESFKRYNIGLGTFSGENEFRIHYFPQPSEPFTNKFIGNIENSIPKQVSENDFNLNNYSSDEVLLSEFSSYAT